MEWEGLGLPTGRCTLPSLRTGVGEEVKVLIGIIYKVIKNRKLLLGNNEKKRKLVDF